MGRAFSRREGRGRGGKAPGRGGGGGGEGGEGEGGEGEEGGGGERRGRREKVAGTTLSTSLHSSFSVSNGTSTFT